MYSEKFTIQWNDSQNNFSKEVAELFNDEAFTDVTLATADDQQLKVLKVILSSSSPFFKKILKKNPHNPLIYLKGINCNELESIIKFIYLGQTEIEEADLPNFLKVARDLEIKGLSDSLKERKTGRK